MYILYFQIQHKMDPDYSAQDVARCNICKTAIAQSYCDFCHVNLCKPCIGEHISDEYDTHKIVPIHKRKSTLIYPKCGTHPNKTCEYKCKDCNISIYFDCLASKHHNKEHDLKKLEELFNTKKTHIQRITEELEKQFLPAYEDIINTINTGHQCLCNVTCLNEEQIWTRGETADIKCLSIPSVLQKKIKTKSGG